MARSLNERRLRGKTDIITPFIIITSLFFIWGFVTNFNGMLTPHLKKACRLTDAQLPFINFSFFAAYFIMAIPAGIIVKRIGYRKAMTVGLGIALIGTTLFYPAAIQRSFALFLAGLIVMASGITVLQVSANPYIIQLGKSRYGAARLSMAGGFNSIGASLAPYIGGLMILNVGDRGADEYHEWLNQLSPLELEKHLASEANSVLSPYTIIAVMLLITCILFMLARIPSLRHTISKKRFDFSVIKRRHVFLGALGIFFYVGAEVGVLIHLRKYAELESIVGDGLSGVNLGAYFMFLAMIGRFVGVYLLMKVSSRKSLVIVSTGAMFFLLLTMLTTGPLSLYLLMALGFFNSIMWPLIFALGIRGTGKKSIEASAYLVMAIVGGALVPYGVTEYFNRLHETGLERLSFIGVFFCYAFILFYGMRGSAVRLSDRKKD